MEASDVLTNQLPNSELIKLPADRQVAYAVLMSHLVQRKTQRRFYELFPDEDIIDENGVVLIFARHYYAKHLEFFDAGRQYRERCFLAANRVGKTTAGAYEMTAHLTGEYPDWWTGRRFDEPVHAWAAGKKNESTRDIVQKSLLGPIAYENGRRLFMGTGMVPGAAIGKVTWKQGVSELADTVKIRHASGSWSTLGFKSYEQGRGSFEGTSQHCIWADEEIPSDVYGEALVRTMTTEGIILVTFTPLLGMSELVQQFQLSTDRPTLGRM